MNKFINFLAILCAVLFLCLLGADQVNAACVTGRWVNSAGNGVPTKASVTNSAGCAAQVVSLCSYRVYTNGAGWLSTQTLFDSQTIMVQPGQNVTMTVETDNCKNQVDAFVAGACPVFTSDVYSGSDIFLGKMTEYAEVLCVKCTDECTKKYQRVCDGDGYKTCGNYDSDSCLEWNTVTDCDSTEVCTNGSCIDKCADGSCYDKPTVNLTSSGDGTCGASFNLKWTSTDATAFTATGDWSGSKGISGSQSVGSFDGTKTFTIKCWGKGGTATDSVTLEGSGDEDDLQVDAGDDEEIDEDEDVRLDGSVDGNYDDIQWECNGGDLSDDDTLRPTFEAPSKHYDYDKVYTCTLTASNDCGDDSDTVKIRVNAGEEDEDIDIELSVEPDNGCAALNDVDLTAEVSDDSNDNEDYKYQFDCENDGDWDKTVTDESDSYTAKNLCDYDESGTYTAKVKVTSSGRSATDTVTIKVKDCEDHEIQSGNISITKSVSNLSSGTGYQGTVAAQPGQQLAYKIVIKAIDGDAKGVVLHDSMPDNIINIGNLEVDGKAMVGNDLNGEINIGDIDEGETKVITYTATVAGDSSFGFGQTALTNVATAAVDGDSASSQATVNVYRQAVQGATTVSTGFGGSAAAAMVIGLIGMLLVAGFTLRDKIKAIFTKRDRATELQKKIDYVKKNNLID